MTEDARKALELECAACSADMCEPEFNGCLRHDCPHNCYTCHGSGVVNPLTAPPGFFCTGVTDCPTCDGTGDAP